MKIWGILKNSLIFSKKNLDLLIVTFLSWKISAVPYLHLHFERHNIRIIGPRKKDEGFEVDTLITIPFWYFPENNSLTGEIQTESTSENKVN